MGTLASEDDEWIELYNPSLTQPIVLDDGWRLVADDGSLDILLIGTISPNSYFLLERAREQVTSVPYNQIFFGALDDNGETLRLRAPDGSIVDTANSDGGAWPAGTVSPNGSMERMDDIPDEPLAWVTNVDVSSWTHTDAAGQLVHGTPGEENWGFSVTHTPIPTNTSTSTPTFTPTPVEALTIVINEVAWAGTQASSEDEWIELYNPSTVAIDLTSWTLKSSDGSPSITLSGTLLSGEYFLLERTDNDTVADVNADMFYSGTLSNSGEILRLYDPNDQLVDTANSNGGSWPAGSSSTYSSMERSLVSADSDFVWVTYDASHDDSNLYAHDSSGNVIKGTPGRGNRPTNVTPTVTPGSTATEKSSSSSSSGSSEAVPILGVSEFLPRPGHDWNNDGKVDVYDEFIEIINAGTIDVDLGDYKLDDEQDQGSSPYTLPAVTLKPGQRAVFYAAETGILLSDAGDTVRLLKTNNAVVDARTYGVVRYPDQSTCRIPDRMGYWNKPCFPTPGNPNALTGDFPPLPSTRAGAPLPVCLLPDTTPPEFVAAECDASGGGVWNRQFWDGYGPFELPLLDDSLKWETIFE
ncbi:MAG: lamin tail domain-containing protein [Chloroflexota bacterium]